MFIIYGIQDTDLQELLRGMHHLRSQLSEHTTQLKTLVKENFDRFVASKNTIDDVHTKLKKTAEHGSSGVDGVSPADIEKVLASAQTDAQRTFSGLLERQARAERIKLALGLLERYDTLLSLPSSVRVYLDEGDYAGLVDEYLRAKSLLAGKGAGRRRSLSLDGEGQQQQQGSVWDSILEEVEKVRLLYGFGCKGVLFFKYACVCVEKVTDGAFVFSSYIYRLHHPLFICLKP